MARESTDIASAIQTVNDKISEQNVMLVAISSALDGKAAGGGSSSGDGWVRPPNFPNYDYIDRSNEEAVYLSCDCRIAKKCPDRPFWLTLRVRLVGTDYVKDGVQIEQGYIDRDGFHAELTFTYVQQEEGYMPIRLPSDGQDFCVLRITPTSEDLHIDSDSFYGGPGGINFEYQYCVERWGRLPYATRIGEGRAYSRASTVWLQSDDVIRGTSLTMANAWTNGQALTNIRFFGNLTPVGSLGGAFQNCIGLRTLDVSNWDVSNVTNVNNCFNGCRSLTTLDVSNWDVSKVTDANNCFNGCRSLTTLDVSNWDVSKVTNLYATFYDCTNLATIDVSNWDVSKVASLNATFYGCANLATLDVSNWDVSNVTTLFSAFYNCTNLTAIDVSNWDVSKVTTLNATFYGCANLATIDVSNWDVSSVTNANNCFRGCQSLTAIDVSNWDVSKVTNVDNCFNGCQSLTTLDVSNWDVSKMVIFGGWLVQCYSLVEFYPPKKVRIYMDMGSSDKLSDASIVRVIDALQTVETTQTVKFHATVKKKLTDEQIATINAKGWSIA